MEEIILVGGGGQCRAAIDIIEAEKKFSIAGIVDLPEMLGHETLGYRMIATDDDIPELVKRYTFFLITIGQLGTGEKRRDLFNYVSSFHVNLPVIISPFSHVSPHSHVEPGTIIHHGAIVGPGARIGRNCIINSRALVEHDATVGDHCHISTATVINGGVRVGEGSFVGSMAVTKQYTEIPPYSFIKAGSLFKG